MMRKRASAAIATLFILLGAGMAQTPRLTKVITSSAPRNALVGTVSAKARRATDLGELPLETPVKFVSLRFSLTPAQQTDLSRLLDDQQNPASPLYHQWLTPEQFGARFGLAPVDVARVTAFLLTQGLTIEAVSRSRSFITVSGTAGQLKTALGVALHAVSLDGVSHITNLTEPILPAELATVTAGITGLNDFRLKPRVRVAQVAAPGYTSSTSGAHYLAPGDLYTIYDINPLLTTAVNGSGVTIAVLGQTDIPLASVAAFRAASGLTANAPTVKLYGADPGTSANDLPEALLDVEWAGAIAPAATILYVNSTDVIAGSLTSAVDNNLAPILSISYGDCEQDFGAANIATYNQVLRQANAQGQTVVGATGDTGATDCDYNATIATQGLAVDYPASSPNVTAVGGTMFNEGSGTYFNATDGAYSGSALSYIPEAAWNETTVFGALAGGSGGASAYFTKPGYQVGPGVPNDFARDVPDLSLASAAVHDGYLICTPGYCTNGYRSAGGALTVIGGTSVAVPEFAGMLALLEQKILARVGNANPGIYGLAFSRYASAVFHDITSGNNAMPCAAGSTGCPTGGSLGYTAGTGYDLATGWGSVDAFNFVSDWPLATPTGTGSNTGMTPSSVVLLDSASTVVAGGTITFSAQVTSAIATPPTGTVQFLVDNVPSGGAVAVGSGAVTYPLATTGLTPGAHIVTAAYSGDSNFLGSKASVQIAVLPSTTPDFSLSPSAFSVTTQSGSNATPITFTVNSINGFSGPVTFLATTTSSTFSTTGAYSFLPPQVTLAAASSGATVLTLSAFRSSSFPAARGLALVGNGLALSFLCWPLWRRRQWAVLLAIITTACLMSVVGCASSIAIPAPTAPTNTPAGTYTVLVTATGTNSSGAVTSHNATVTFVVQ